MYRKTFFFGPGNIRIISQHSSNEAAYKHSSSSGLVNGSGGDSSSISKASAAVCGVPAVEDLKLIENLTDFHGLKIVGVSLR